MHKPLQESELCEHLYNFLVWQAKRQEAARRRLAQGLPVEEFPVEEIPKRKSVLSSNAEPNSAQLDVQSTFAYYDSYDRAIWVTNKFFGKGQCANIKARHQERLRQRLDSPLQDGVSPVTALVVHELFHFLADLTKEQLVPHKKVLRDMLFSDQQQAEKVGLYTFNQALKGKVPNPVALDNIDEYLAERCMEYCLATPQVRRANPNIKRVFDIVKGAYDEFVKAKPAASKKS